MPNFLKNTAVTLHWSDERVLRVIGDQAEIVLSQLGEELIVDMVDSMKPGTGRWYRSKRGDGSWHQASEALFPPAPDTRRLINSLYKTVERLSGGRNITLYVSTTSPYARAQELGKRFLAPRPYMRPAFIRIRGKVLARFRNMMGE